LDAPVGRLLMNCRQVTQLVSQSMDAKLPLYRRLAVRFHLLYCVWCRRYVAQLKFLRKAAKGLAETTDASSPKLSAESKDQMRKRLEEALKNSSSSPR
jgi:hypothetical protein